MANTKQSIKRARQAEVRRQHNMSLRSNLRTHIKKVLSAIAEQTTEKTEQAYNAAVKVIDRMAHKGIIHKNKAARHKSRLLAKIRKNQQQATAS